MRKIPKLIICFMVCLASLSALVACGDKLTAENFNAITCATLDYNSEDLYTGGMSLDEVKGILGEPDDSSSSSMMGITTTVYVWGSEKKYISVSFYNGKAIAKSQIGIN